MPNSYPLLLASGESRSSSTQLHSKIRRASQAEGVNYDYMIKTAQRESSLDPRATASTSSAAGLFQFTEQTWLSMVKKYGAEFGLRQEQYHIAKERDGSLSIRNPQAKKRILNLRFNPELASQMAAKLAKNNAQILQKSTGKMPSNGDMYVAHFLGAGGAAKMLNVLESNPHQRADRVFSSAAKANPSIFYQNKRPRSVAQVYEALTKTFDNGISKTDREMILQAHNGNYGQVARPSEAISADPEHLFQGLFFEAAKNHENFLPSSVNAQNTNTQNRIDPTGQNGHQLFQTLEQAHTGTHRVQNAYANPYGERPATQAQGLFNAYRAKPEYGNFFNGLR